MANRDGPSRACLPLQGKSLYIDEIDIPKAKLKRLERSTTLLGAKLEKFFTKDISYLVTDHAASAEYKKSQIAAAEGASPLAPSPFTYTPGSNLGTPPEVTATTSTLRSGGSRASLMLSKSQKNSKFGSVAPISVSEQLIRNAKQWSIKMVQTDVALKWMEKKIIVLGLHKSRNVPREHPERAARSRAKVLQAPYIKIEDLKSNARPVYRQFAPADVPVLNLDAVNCPFVMGDDEPQEETPALKKLQKSSPTKSKTLTTPNKNLTNKKGKVLMKGRPRKKGRSSAANNQVRKKLSFCMSCKVRYESLDQHIRSDQHQSFANNNDNYTAVDQLIEKNASMQKFLDDIIKYQKLHEQEGLEEEVLAERPTEEEELTDERPIEEGPPAEVDGPVDALLTPPHGDTQLIVDIPHKSVSDGGGSPPHQEEVVVTEEVVEEVISRRSPRKQKQSVPLPDIEIAAASKPTLTACELTFPLECKPNMSKVETKAILPPSPSKSTRTSQKEGAYRRRSADARLATTPMGGDNESIHSFRSDISSAELVKIRKRGRKSVEETKRKPSPAKLKRTKSTPRQLKTDIIPAVAVDTQPSRKANGITDLQTHWALLCGNQAERQDANASFGLPMDISYGALSDNQLENMALQKTSVGVMDGADRSLVQSIYGLLANVNFNNNSNADESADMDSNDPLLSCDSYISNKISVKRRNSMLSPTTPRKSPRTPLGARDYTDEHFSPHKQRLTLSIEKNKLANARKSAARVSKLNFDRPISTEFLSPTENKENSLALLSTTSDRPAVVFPRIRGDDDVTNSYTKDHSSSVLESVGVTTACHRDTILSPEHPVDIDNHSIPLHASTPAAVPNSQHPDKVKSTNKPSASSHTIKKSLFAIPSTQATVECSLLSPVSKFQQKLSGAMKHLSDKRRRRSSVTSKHSVSFATHIVDGTDCFGFDEATTVTKHTVRTAVSGGSNGAVSRGSNGAVSGGSNGKPVRMPYEYERQSSLLSFGSVSLSQYDDVFSLPPDVQQDSIESSVYTVEPNSTPQRRSKSSNNKSTDHNLAAPGITHSSVRSPQSINNEVSRTKRSGPSPTKTPNKKLRLDCELHDSTPPTTPGLLPALARQLIVRISPLSEVPSFPTRRPSIVRELELRQISERDISTCSAYSSDEEADCPAYSSPRKPKPQANIRRVPDLVLKRKFDYKIGSRQPTRTSPRKKFAN